jgi:5-methylcytosine-specific restriction endonuclease McrA
MNTKTLAGEQKKKILEPPFSSEKSGLFLSAKASGGSSILNPKGEAHRRACRKFWRTHKNDPIWMEKIRAIRRKGMIEYRKTRRELLNKKQKEYARNNSQKIRVRTRRYRDEQFFDGKRESVMKRDNFKCAECGLSRQEHYKKYGDDLDIHHKDGKGRQSDIKNNRLSNLITLCHMCHMKKHFIGYWKNRRRDGKCT